MRQLLNSVALDVALIAHGTLPDQKACEASVTMTLAEIDNNGLSVVALCTLLGNHFEAQGSGSIAVISSVAGDRGRQSNYALWCRQGHGHALPAGAAQSAGEEERAGADDQARLSSIRR